jgi:hypothetical protein
MQHFGLSSFKQDAVFINKKSCIFDRIAGVISKKSIEKIFVNQAKTFHQKLGMFDNINLN